MANYAVSPELLASRVPRGTELDLFEGECFVSLVGFMFLETRVLGIPVPFHVNFEEVNLRFYVRREQAGEIRRGVVFIKEIVPRFMIAAIARSLYGEPYERWQMANTRTSESIDYRWQKDDRQNVLFVKRGRSLGVPEENSHGEFIIEHYWGYTKRNEGRTDEYRVEHPKWELFGATAPHIGVDFGATYGDEFEFLSSSAPSSVLLAAGSAITVYKGKPIHFNESV